MTANYFDCYIKAVGQFQICQNAAENRLVTNGEDPTLHRQTLCYHELLHKIGAEGHPSDQPYFLLCIILEAAEGKLQVKLQRGLPLLL